MCEVFLSVDTSRCNAGCHSEEPEHENISWERPCRGGLQFSRKANSAPSCHRVMSFSSLCGSYTLCEIAVSIDSRIGGINFKCLFLPHSLTKHGEPLAALFSVRSKPFGSRYAWTCCSPPTAHSWLPYTPGQTWVCHNHG